MKNILYLGCVIALLGCSRDFSSEISNSNSLEKRKALLEKIINSPELKDSSIEQKYEVIKREFSANKMMTPVLHGPFKVTVPAPSPMLPNLIKVIYKGPDSYPTPGVYYADVYKFQATIPLPDNAFAGNVTAVETPGFVDYYNHNQIGFTSNFNTVLGGGKNITAHTYTLALMYNSVGQYMGMVLPSPSTSKTFHYSYITL